jgi:hypothetical protein
MDIDYSSLCLHVIPPIEMDIVGRTFVNQCVHVGFFDLLAVVCVLTKEGPIPIMNCTTKEQEAGNLILRARKNMAKAFPAKLETSNGALRRLLAELEAESREP